MKKETAQLFLAAGAFIIILGAAIAFQDGSYLHYESRVTLMNYLKERNLFAKIFDIAANDFHCYQARELSYFFNWLDAEFIRWSIHFGWVHFFSVFHFLGVFAIALGHLMLCRRYFPKAMFGTNFLVCMLYLTTPVAVFSGVYTRTSKIAIAVMLYFFLWFVYLELKKERVHERPWFSAPSLLKSPYFWIPTVMAWMDRQGFFLMLLFAVFFGFYAWLRSSPIALRAMRQLIVAVIFNVFYNYIIGRGLSYLFGNGWPNMWFQKIDTSRLFHVNEHWIHAAELFVEQLNYFFGNRQTWLGLGFLLVLMLFFVRSNWWTTRPLNGSTRFKRLKSDLDRHFPLVIFLGASLCNLGLFALMDIKNVQQNLPDVRIVYYWLPTQALILFALVFVIARISELLTSARARIAFQSVLLLMLVGNIQAWPKYLIALKGGLQGPQWSESPELQDCIRHPEKPLANYSNIHPDSLGVCKFFRNR